MTDELTFTSDKLKGFTFECDCTRAGTMATSTGHMIHRGKGRDTTKLTSWNMEYFCTAHKGPMLGGSPDARDAMREVLRDNGILPK